MNISKKEARDRISITMKTQNKVNKPQFMRWWELGKPHSKETADALCSTVLFLKESQGFRQRQAAVFARLYGNQNLFGFVGSNMSKMDQYAGLPPDRPTFNLVASVTDTLVSKLTQSRPSPVFLTNNGDYKERNLAKKLTNFTLGEFYRCKAYEKAEFILRDALVEGTGCLKVYETQDKKIGLDRVLLTELFVDLAESYDDNPRSLYQVKLIDRGVLLSTFPKYEKLIAVAESTTPDKSAESSRSISDLVLVVEGWHLPSGPDAGDGRHTIACSSGVLFDEKWTKPRFPFVFLHHKRRMLGFWSQGVAETLMGTQMELNGLLSTISRSIKLVGVPRVFIEDGSKVVKSSLNNEIGVIINYRGVKPSYEVAPCVPQEMYQERDRLIQYGYEQEGLSSLAATSQKPQGLDSGEAIRTYDDINTDRFAALSRRYDNFFIDLAYQIIDGIKEIADREGSYSTTYLDKRKGTQEIEFKGIDIDSDSYVIQCFNESSLPRDPAGRKQTVSEMIQSGMLTIKEGRRLLDFPDLDQIETLANASEERIFKYLDDIVEVGKFEGPDPFLDLSLAEQLVVQYYNLYSCRKLEEDRCQMLRDFFSQVQLLKASSMPPEASGLSPQPLGVPLPPPVSQNLPISQPNANS